MRALPPLTLTVSRFPIWNAAVGVLAALALASLGAWAHAWRESLGPGGLLGLAALAASAAWLAVGLWQGGAARLSWDGARWQLGEVPTALPCDCTVAADLGHWMLLRCRTPRTFWLPVQRGQTGCDWHSLRCTVYSPRPAPVRRDGSDRPA